jgi:putative redox protein
LEVEKFITAAHARIGLAKYQTTINSGGHQFIVDEPEIKGGADTGANPQSLLLASLGSCTAITLRMYIDRKQWPVEEISIDLKMFKTETSYIIRNLLGFKGELSTEQQTRLLQIANACPIHKLLENCLTIETLLK